MNLNPTEELAAKERKEHKEKGLQYVGRLMNTQPKGESVASSLYAVIHNLCDPCDLSRLSEPLHLG
jgi:hypothetical protein